MNVYDTLIIGSGYGSIGYAVANKNAVVCEEHQLCDTGFCLPLRSFQYVPYVPKTAEGARLQEIFHSLDLFHDTEQNANGFEFALCKYITERPLKVWLKCRVIAVEKRADGVYDVTVQTNEGLSHLFAKKILNTVGAPKQKYLTVLFTAEDADAAKAELLALFQGATIDPAFYDGRYALHIPADGFDENAVKLMIYQKWRGLNAEAKILYIAPVFFGEDPSVELCDMYHTNPVEAFEAGYFYAAKEEV